MIISGEEGSGEWLVRRTVVVRKRERSRWKERAATITRV
jgi:hypothetical protein